MEQLDDLDIQILADLGNPHSRQWNVRESYASLAKRLGVDEETVRLRVKHARESGLMPSWRIVVNPRLVGHGAAGVDLEVADGIPKSKVIAQLKLIPGMMLIVDFRERRLVAILWYEDDDGLRRTTELLGSLCGSPVGAVWLSLYEEPELKMRRIDWRILGAMKDDARMDLGEVAGSLGVSVRTVQRRLRVMTSGKAIHLAGTPNVERASGLICDFLVSSPDVLTKRAADAAVRSEIKRIGASDTTPDHYSEFGLSCENLTQADEVLSRLKSLYRVDSVRMGIVREFLWTPDWLTALIRRMAGADRSTAQVHS